MRAVVYDRYGPPEVLRLDDVERPIPKQDEVLVKIHRFDVHTREANRGSGLAVMALSRLVSGVRRPRQRVLGSEFAGVVEEIGAAVTEYAVGDSVFGDTGLRFGCHAEFTCMRESDWMARKPARMSFEAAAAVCDGALNTLWILRKGDVQKGQKVLVYGSSGSCGTAAVQLTKYFGADVTAVCKTKNVELARSLGSDRVIDGTQRGFHEERPDLRRHRRRNRQALNHGAKTPETRRGANTLGN